MKLENFLLFSERSVYALWNRMHIQINQGLQTIGVNKVET